MAKTTMDDIVELLARSEEPLGVDAIHDHLVNVVGRRISRDRTSQLCNNRGSMLKMHLRDGRAFFEIARRPGVE